MRNVDKIVISCGAVTTAVLWEAFGNKGVGYISNKINEIGQKLQLSPGYTDWFKPDYIVGVTLSGQIFIKACGNHSPVINFAEKSVIILGYYTPTVLTYQGAKNFISSFNYTNADVIKAGAIGIAGFSGGMIGAFCQSQIGGPLDKAATNIDVLAKNTVAIVYATFNLLIGNAKAESIEEYSSQQDMHVDLLAHISLSGEHSLSNTTAYHT